MHKQSKFLLAVAVPLLILALLALKPTLTVVFGQEIILETKAVDPTDLFRGDYVALNFKISDVPRTEFTIPIESVINKQLYVALKKQGQIYVIDTVSDHKPKSDIYLKARIKNYYNLNNEVQLDYGLDRYFVKQGSGMALQEKSNGGHLLGKVKVWKGYGVLTEIITN